MIKKSKGITKSEQLLTELCEQAFLKLWSYPNVFRDQGQTPRNHQGKEICDLLVVFEREIIIFSDKSCSLTNSGDLHKDWRRWFDKAIMRSTHQIYGAERWIKKFPEKIFLDNECRQRFPLRLESIDEYRFHRIIIATGARERCKQEMGNTGSLAIIPKIISDDHIKPTAASYHPFAIGQIDPSRGFIHVLDDVTSRILLEELDTTQDFVDYLIEKEKIILSGVLVAAASEEDLLAVYMRNAFQTDRFIPSDSKALIIVDNGCWENWKCHPSYMEKKTLDQPSHQVWDKIINIFGKNALEGTVLPESSLKDVSDIEACLRIMASETRLSRRGLSEKILEKMLNTKPDKTGSRVLTLETAPDKGYALLLYPRKPNDDPKAYRSYRKAYHTAWCYVCGERDRKLKQIVGIATESGKDKVGETWDFCLFKPGEWTQEKVAIAVELDKYMKYGTTTKRSIFTEWSLPEKWIENLERNSGNDSIT